MNTDIHNILIPADLSIREAMAVIEAGPKSAGVAGIAVITDSDDQLQGVVTDGDIRSAILHDIDLDQPVSAIMTTQPIAVTQDDSPARMVEAVLALIRDTNRMLDRDSGKIIVKDGDGRVMDVVSFWSLLQQSDVKSKRIAIIGLGFVGLTLAVVLADVGFHITGVEKRPEVIESLQNGKPHFYESGLASRIRYHVGRTMEVVSTLKDAAADVYVISVGTPVNQEHQPILSFVETSAAEIGRVLKRGDVVMLRSTVPVGTTRNFCLPILERESGLKAGKDFSLVFAPERTVAGKAIKELRVLPQVIGALDSRGAETAAAIFRELTPTIVMVESLEAAEMVKLVNNSFRDLVFSFANEIALVCEQYEMDVFEIIQAANEGYPRDPVPLPSPGVGGVCLKKDPYLLLATARQFGYESQLIGRSRAVNEYMPRHVFKKFLKFIESTGRTPVGMDVFVVGFAFKGWPETSDIRDSSTLDLVAELHAAGVNIRGYDPVVSPETLATINGVQPVELADGFSGADCVFIMNNHPSYEDWSLYSLLETMRRPAFFFDGWHIFQPEDVSKVQGIHYGSLSIDHNRAGQTEKDALPG
jgi:UDP-N-acetyl-D-mannosaminuronic acid dehydrogenase